MSPKRSATGLNRLKARTGCPAAIYRMATLPLSKSRMGVSMYLSKASWCRSRRKQSSRTPPILTVRRWYGTPSMRGKYSYAVLFSVPPHNRALPVALIFNCILRGMEKSSFLNPALVVRAARLYEGLTVADFGAGSGFFTRAAARLVGERGIVWAVDVHQDLLPRLKNLALAEGLRNVEVVCGDVEKQKGSHLPEGNFDVVRS